MKKGTSFILYMVLCLLVWSKPLFAQTSTPRVISLSPAATELLYDLDLASYLVAIDQASNYPPQTAQLPSVGNSLIPQAELIALYQPNIVIEYSPSSKLHDLQKQMGFTLLTMNPQTMDEFLLFAQKITQLLQQDRQDTLTAWEDTWKNLKTEWQTRPLSQEKVFIFVGGAPLYTLGKNAFLSQALSACHLQTLFHEKTQAAFMVSTEQLLHQPPTKVLAGAPPLLKEAKRQEILHYFQHLGIDLKPENIVIEEADILWRPSLRFLQRLPLLCRALH